jgi:DNA mismatch repair protein MutS
MPNDDITPIRQQYLEIKREHPDAILFFRHGDFCETFDQDAGNSLARARPGPHPGMWPGSAYHGRDSTTAENYLARLIEKGYHVAICEQVGDQPVKGLFPGK